jgi:hypothetical protein
VHNGYVRFFLYEFSAIILFMAFILVVSPVILFSLRNYDDLYGIRVDCICTFISMFSKAF